jgi:hypothetical protein
MASDRDRLTFDAKQQYRSVVAQQGRVMVPVDFNEAQEIAGTELREEALDFVGASGTPDNGYEISFPAPSPTDFDFLINPGTMYVGGLRAFLPPPEAGSRPISYFHQPDWLDPALPSAAPVQEFVCLSLREQEIGAVEDTSLKDVALGGPDTTQRTRLIQQILRGDTKGTDCASALTEQIAAWNADGQTFDSKTMRLTSLARLKVGFDQSGPPPSLCDPVAQGGYLGAENQLICVRISEAKTLVWGFDNSSFLYRVTLSSDNRTLVLDSPPVDSFHFPKVGQAVQLLRTQAKLADGGLIATDTGPVFTLAEAYNPDTQSLKLPSTFTASAGTPQLFLRVWEQERQFTAGTPTPLGSTGLQVTLQAPGNIFHVGDFWAFAARPSTPVKVYPTRYLDDFQPPDGPYQWICPLAVIGWTQKQGALVSDCRDKFDNLVELTKRKASGCCTVVVKPEDLANTSLQDIINKLPEKVPARVCLSPGDYALPKPVVIQRADLIIEACPGGASLRAKTAHPAFRFGLICLQGANRVQLRGLEFVLPEAALESARFMGLSTKDVLTIGGPRTDRVSAFIGVRMVDTTDVTVQDCHFQFPKKAKTPSVFAAGIFSSGRSVNLTVRNNIFERVSEEGSISPIEITQRDFVVCLGYVQAHSALAKNPEPGPEGARQLSGVMNGALLDHIEIRDNRFSGLSAAMLAQGELGFVRVEDNVVEQSYSGFWLLTPHTIGFAEQVFKKDHKDLAAKFNEPVLLSDPMMLIASCMARALEWPLNFSDAKAFNGVVFPANPPFPPTVSTDLTKRFFQVFIYLALMEQQAFGRPNQFAPEIHVSGNQIVALPANVFDAKVPNSGPGLVIWCDDVGRANDKTPKFASAVVDANRIGVVHKPGAGAIVQLVTSCAVDGNVVLNEAPSDDKVALLVWTAVVAKAVPPVAISGNVCHGKLVAPNRPLAAPFDTWDNMNTVIP